MEMSSTHVYHATLCCTPFPCVRPSVRRSATSRYCIETTGQIKVVFGMEASFTYPTLCYKETRVPKINYFPLELCTNFGLIRKFLYGKSIVLYEQLLCAFAPNLTNAADEMNIN